VANEIHAERTLLSEVSSWQ